jgi:hypothetical protein
VDVQSAIAYVRQRATAVELAGLKYALRGEPATREAVKALFADQRGDGGFAPPWARDYSSPDATCFRLAQAEQIGVSGFETAVRRAVQFLIQGQLLDGSWKEDESVAAVAPVWAQPGNLAARLYLTANCGLWVAAFSGVGPNSLASADSSIPARIDSAVRAADYLKSYLQPDGRLPSFLHAHWLAAGLWHRLDYDDLSQQVLSYLATRLAGMSANNLTWLLTTLLGAGVPASNSLIMDASSMLERYQNPDGRWISDDGPEFDVHCTLEALRVLTLLGAVPRYDSTDLSDE